MRRPTGLTAILPSGAAARAGFDDGLMEFLEMDFDKSAAVDATDN